MAGALLQGALSAATVALVYAAARLTLERAGALAAALCWFGLTYSVALSGVEFALHALHVVNVVLKLDVWLAQRVEQRQRVARVGEQIRAVLPRIQRLDQERDPRAARLLGRPVQIFAHPLQLYLNVFIRTALATQRVQMCAAHSLRQLDRHRQVGAKPRLAIGVVQQPAVAGRHVAGVKVEQRHTQPGIANAPRDGGQILAGRPPELDRPETEPGRLIEAFQK